MVKFNWNSTNHILIYQFAAKDLERKSKKCEKEEKAEKLKLKKVSGIYDWTQLFEKHGWNQNHMTPTQAVYFMHGLNQSLSQSNSFFNSQNRGSLKFCFG